MINKFKNTCRKIKTGLLIIIMCLAFSFSASAQDSKGTDFWLMFNTNLSTPTLTLFVTSGVNTSGTVSGPSFAAIPFTVTANTVTSVVIPNALATHTSDVVDNRGIHVTSLQEITVDTDFKIISKMLSVKISILACRQLCRMYLWLQNTKA